MIMAKCERCGAEIEPGAAVCGICGAPAPDPASYPKPVFGGLDHTCEYEADDIKKGRFLSLLCYLWIFVLIPVFAARGSDFVRFHRRQGILLFVIETAYAFLMSVVLSISRAYLDSFFVFFLGLFLYLILGVFAAYCVYGVIHAVKGKAAELPYIGQFAERFKN